MERSVVGMLIDVGREKMLLDAVRKLVALPTKTSMLTALPAGLFLERVYWQRRGTNSFRCYYDK